jgi:hypothetical protein
VPSKYEEFKFIIETQAFEKLDELTPNASPVVSQAHQQKQKVAFKTARAAINTSSRSNRGAHLV